MRSRVLDNNCEYHGISHATRNGKYYSKNKIVILFLTKCIDKLKTKFCVCDYIFMQLCSCIISVRS